MTVIQERWYWVSFCNNDTGEFYSALMLKAASTRDAQEAGCRSPHRPPVSGSFSVRAYACPACFEPLDSFLNRPLYSDDAAAIDAHGGGKGEVECLTYDGDQVVGRRKVDVQ